MDRRALDLQFGGFGNRARRHRREREAQRIGVEARKTPDLQTKADDPTDAVLSRFLIEHREQALANRHLMHRDSLPRFRLPAQFARSVRELALT